MIAPSAVDADEGSARGVLVGSLGFAGAVTALMHTLAIPLLPELPGALDTSITATSWVASVTLVAGGVAAPVVGRMGDMYGKRRMVLISLALAVAGSIVAATAGSLALLLVGRLLQGLALGVVPLSLAILRDELAPERLGRGVAAVSAFMLGLGTGFGPLFAGGVLDAFGWRAVFWVAAAMSGLALLLVARFVGESPQLRAGAFDWPGSVGLSATVVLLLLVITRGGDWGWTSPPIVSLVLGAAVVGAAWARWERQHATPLVDLAVTLQRPVLITHLAGVMVGFAAFAQYLVAFTLVALSADTGHGFGRTMLVAGLTQAPGAAIMIGAAPAAALIARARGAPELLVIGSATVAAGFTAGVVWHDQLWHLATSATLIYFGVGLAYCALPLLLMANVPVSETGAANAVNNLSRVIGSVVAAAVASAILAAAVEPIAGGRHPAHWAFVAIYVLGGVAAAGTGVLALTLPAPVSERSLGRRRREGSIRW
jgi:MFS family permease